MGLFQPHGGYRRCNGDAVITSPAGRGIIINGLAGAIAAIDAARSANQTIDLVTAPGASSYIGPALFKTIVDEARRYGGETLGAIFYDCDNHRGHVLAGLRAGLRQFYLEETAITPALMDIVAQHGAILMPLIKS